MKFKNIKILISGALGMALLPPVHQARYARIQWCEK